MTTTQKNVFILGATGYIGGSFLDALWKHPKANSFNIIAYVRSPEKAKRVERVLGLKTVTGPLSVVQEAASKADIVLNFASSDDLPLTEAILAGAKKHYASTQVPTILLHTSGTGIVTDKAMGKHAIEVTVDDADSDTINALPVTQWHRNVDIPIVAAHREGFVKSYIVYPGFIFGQATGKVVDLGIQHPSPTAVMIISKVGIARGSFGVVGPMKNVWSVVHIHDVLDLYKIIFEAIITGKNIPSGPDGHYIAENGLLPAEEYFPRIARALHELGALKAPEVSQFTQEELDGSLLSAFGTNSRTSSSRSRSIGWKPAHPPQEFLDGLKEGVKVMLEWDQTQ